MSACRGRFIKYKVKFVDTNLTVSNDQSVGDYVLDSDVTVWMSRDLKGTSFKIRLYDLPETKVQALAATLGSKPIVQIELGYFETTTQLVVTGVYEKVESVSYDDQLVTTITGRETAYYACANTLFKQSLPPDHYTCEAAANQVLKLAQLAPSQVATRIVSNDLPSGTLCNPVFRATTVLGVLDEIAECAAAELLVLDGKVLIGSPIRCDDVAAATLDRSVNLAAFQPIKRQIPSTDQLNFPNPLPAKELNGFSFTVLGDPTMRPGQKVVVSQIKGYDDQANPEFRIRQVTHDFSARSGYVCSGVAAARLADGSQARALDAAAERSAASAARDVVAKIRKQALDNPPVEITAIKAATDPYQADLYYGQPADNRETQPSINAAVTQSEDQVYHDKPIAAPFAWRKCGLVTPVYPGMKALTLHNRGITSDGVVAGYLWSKDPDFPPPSNQAGDWWLCLPIDFDATQPPADSTKAANDLTANDGCRVIELKGLKITVGADALNTVGNRPNTGDPEQCTIAHASGAMVTIKNGEIDVAINPDGSGPKLTLTPSGITLTDGTLNVTLAQGKLAIG